MSKQVKRVKRIIKGICTSCWGLGQVATPKGRQTCEDCGGTGERELVLIEEVSE